MPFAIVGEVTLHYDEAGAGDPPILFVHGWTCTNAHFEPQMAYFAPTHRVVAVDLRGHGRSDKPEQEYTITGFADDMVAFCREVGLERPVVVGHSMGGAVALELAARAPDLV